MKHSEHAYFEAGYKYERGTMSMHQLQALIEGEAIDERADARYLVERGRQEARQSTIQGKP